MSVQPFVLVPIYRPDISAPTSLLNDMNTDCMLSILRLLSLDDLTTLTEVSVKFRDLAIEAFRYEWKNKTIRLSNNGLDNTLISKEILRYFGSHLRKLIIEFHNHGKNTFLQLIVDKCSSDLKEVNFSSTCLNSELDQILSEKTIRVFNAKFKNLVTLTFDETVESITAAECIEQHFPALEELTLSSYPFTHRNIRRAIKLNPQLKSLSSFHCNSVKTAATMVEMIDRRLPLLEKLGLGMHGLTDTIQFQPRFLKALRHLNVRNCGNTSNLQHLSISKETVEEMVLELSCCDEGLVDFICQHKEITKLAIRVYNSDYPIDFTFLPKLEKRLPKLTELEVRGCWKELNHADIAHFVRGSKGLVTFTIRDRKCFTPPNSYIWVSP